MHVIDQCKIPGVFYAKTLIMHIWFSFDYYNALN